MSGSSRLRRILRDPLILPYYLPALMFAVSEGMLVPVLPIYARDFGVSYGLVGLVLAGEGFGMLLGDVPAGMLIRRVGKKGTMLLGIGCAVLSTVMLFWAGHISEVLVWRLLAGFGRAFYNVSRHAYMVDAVTVASRGRAMAVWGGVFRIGGFAGPVVGGTVATAYGLQGPFLLSGGACAVALIVIAIFMRDMETRPQRGSVASRSKGNYLLSTLRAHYPVLASAGTGQLLAQMIRAGRKAIIPLYAADVIGLDVQAIGYVVSISSAIDMSLFYPAGLIMDRLGRKCAIVPSFVIQAIGMSLVPLTGDFSSLLFVSAVIGFGSGIGSGCMMTLGADLAPQELQGEFLGVWRLIGDAGRCGAPLIVGSVADLVMLQPATWMMTGVGLIAGMIFALFVPETLKKRRRCSARSF